MIQMSFEEPEYLAFFSGEIHGPAAQIGLGPLALSYSDLVIKPGIFPIAETNTLEQGYYANVTELDTRYPADMERQHYVSMLEDFAALNSEKVPSNLVEMFRTCVLEPKFLAMYFDSSDSAKEDPEAISRFFGEYSVASYEEVLAIRNTYYGVPLPLREFAREDVGTVHDVMREVASIGGIGEVIDARVIAHELEHAGVGGLKGKDRLAAVRALKEDLTERVAQILVEQGSDRSESTAYIRVHRKQSPLDGLDAATFRSCTNNDVMVDPSYLLNPRYDRLMTEPDVSGPQKLGFLKHMVNGEYRFGHAHPFLYRNKNGVASTHAGVIPDYGVSRPGNFIYHDLKLLEKGPYKGGFPLEALQEYLLSHYLEQMDSDNLDNEGKPLRPERGAIVAFRHEDKLHGIPLVWEPENAIPFRALKKDYNTTEYYEYGEECYLAELVDMSLQLGLISEMRDGKVGSDEAFVSRLKMRMEGLKLSDGRDAVSVVIEQLEFMKGRKPLTCAFEWFISHSREVSEVELVGRGVSPKKPLFQ